MHEELDRPLRATADKAKCECICTASVRDGDDSETETTRQSNFLAAHYDIGG